MESIKVCDGGIEVRCGSCMMVSRGLDQGGDDSDGNNNGYGNCSDDDDDDDDDDNCYDEDCYSFWDIEAQERTTLIQINCKSEQVDMAADGQSVIVNVHLLLHVDQQTGQFHRTRYQVWCITSTSLSYCHWIICNFYVFL